MLCPSVWQISVNPSSDLPTLRMFLGLELTIRIRSESGLGLSLWFLSLCAMDSFGSLGKLVDLF
jgi:hypothetical protein